MKFSRQDSQHKKSRKALQIEQRLCQNNLQWKFFAQRLFYAFYDRIVDDVNAILYEVNLSVERKDEIIEITTF